MIATRRGAPGARYFQEYVADSGAYLRDVDGLGDGFAPSLYCHQRDWLNANKWVPSSCERIRGEQNCAAKTTCAWKEKTNECVGKSQCTECRRWSTGDALFRDHFECFLAPPLDEWFGFDALPPADDPAWGRRAVAETYAAVDRDAFVDCGAADGELRVVVHVRLGDLIHPDLSANASAEVTLIEMRSEGGHLRNALRVVAALRARLPGRRVHTLILSDSPPETVAATLEGLDVGIHVGGARRDGASHLVDGRTVGLENDFDINQATQLAFDVATKGKRLDKLFSSSPVHNPPHVHAADDYGRGCGRKRRWAASSAGDGAPASCDVAPRSAAAAKRALARNWTRYEALAAFTEVLWRPSAAVRATTAAMRSALDLPAETRVALGVHVRRGDRVHDALSDRTGFTMFDDAEWVDFFAQRTARGVAVVLTQDGVLRKVVNASAARGVRIVHVDAALRRGPALRPVPRRRSRAPRRGGRGAANSGSNMGRAVQRSEARRAGAPAIFDLDGKWTAEDAARGYAPASSSTSVEHEEARRLRFGWETSRSVC
ncbi:hypothetical protein JL721_11410 [Aureococcus anophagefferens]|nr:hypothetical protein JL721_11410 [Aureococcus anophagefferens]